MQKPGRPAPGYLGGRLSFRADVWSAPRDRLRCREPGRAGQSGLPAGAVQGRRVVSLATKLDIPTANAVGVAIGRSVAIRTAWPEEEVAPSPLSSTRLAPTVGALPFHVGDAEPPPSAI
jgi:hypothetical protein